MILWRITTFIGIYQPQISPILLYVRCKFGVHFILRCFRDAKSLITSSYRLGGAVGSVSALISRHWV